MKTRTAALASAVALSAAAVTAAPAYAAPDLAAPTGVVQYADATPDSSAAGSLENEFVMAGLVLVAGIAVSVAMAVGAGVAGGAIEVPQIPGLPF